MLEVFLAGAEGCDGCIHALSLLLRLLLPPGMIQAVETVQRLPPAFVLSKSVRPFRFQPVAMPVFFEGDAECLSLIRLFNTAQQLKRFCQLALLITDQRQFLQGVLPGLQLIGVIGR